MDVQRVKLKMRGINAVMTEAPVVSKVARVSARVRRTAGDGFKSVVTVRKNYTAAYVMTDTEDAKRRQAEDAVLQKSMGAGRDGD